MECAASSIMLSTPVFGIVIRRGRFSPRAKILADVDNVEYS
jgi:hypothetical protein